MKLESAKREALREARQAGVELIIVKDRAAEDPTHRMATVRGPAGRCCTRWATWWGSPARTGSTWP